jgi:hypothetical protein
MSKAGKRTFGGDNISGLNESTILYGVATNITEINFDNITVNPLNFIYPLSIEKIYYGNDSSSNEIRFDVNAYYFKSNVDDIFQKKIIADFGIVLNDNNISVDFSKSGWTINNSMIYTDKSYVGIGVDNPIESLHIRNDKAAIIIDNNINKFKFANIDNYLSIGNDNGHVNIEEEDIYFKQQLKIHRDAPENSLIIDDIGTVNFSSNININNETHLTNKIFIDNLDIINWLGSNGIATNAYVQTSIDDNSSTKIDNLDYNNINKNKLTFQYPLSSNVNNNVISFDTNVIGWNKNDTTIFNNTLKLGIGTNITNLGLVHIGSSAFSAENPIVNDGSLVFSKSTSQNNRSFKFGFDNSFNFIFGNINSTTNAWNSQFSIYNSAPNNSLIIDNSGNININNSLNITSNININGTITLNKFNINYSNNNFILGNSLLFLNNNGFVGVGTTPDNIYRFIVDGHIKTNNNFYGNDIFVNNGTFLNININTITAISTIRSSNSISSNCISTNLSNSSLITTRNLFTSNLITSTNINTTNLNVSTNFNTNSVIANQITSLNINNTNNINTASLITSNLTSTNLTTTDATILKLNSPDIYSSGNIICDNNITSININATNIESYALINTPLINATNINGTVLTIANNISSSNITATNLSSTNLTANNIIVNNNIRTPSTNSTVVNAVNIYSSTINATDNLTVNNFINGNTLNVSKITCSTQIALNITNPISEFHIGNSSTPNINPSIMISSGSTNNFKMGYDNTNNFVFGTYSRNTLIWTNQLSINRSSPANSININSLGNVGIGKTNDNTYKLDVDGTFNATRLFQNNEALLTTAAVNSLINTNLSPYLTSNIANNLYTSVSYVNTAIANNTSYIENTITRVLAKDNNIYTSQRRYPVVNYTVANIIYTPAVYGSIYGIKEVLNETILENNNNNIYTYEIYSSSASGSGDKNLLFSYTNLSELYLISWGINNYNSNNNSTYTTANAPLALRNSSFYSVGYNIPELQKLYNGDYIIFKFNDPIILSKYVFYILNKNINNAPGNWICLASNDAINWEYIINASIELTIQLTRSSYSTYDQSLLYYEKIIDGNDTPYLYYAFIFNKLIFTIRNETLNNFPGSTLQLSKIEFFGKTKIESIYVTTNNLNSTLTNYSTLDQLNQKLNKNITITPPLLFNQNTQTLSYDAAILTTASGDAASLSNLIVNYINDQTSQWKIDSINPNNLYYSFTGCVGIGSTLINRTNIPDLRLDIYGRIRASNLNIISTVNASNFIGNGSLITNLNYNNIITNKPDLKNLNTWNIDSTNNIYSTNSGNVGIGHTYGNILNSKLSVNGNISSTGNISGLTIQENGMPLTDKYLSISTASASYFRNSGGFISASVGINTNSTQSYMLYVNGDTYSSNIVCTNINASNIQENNTNISSKYLGIIDAINTYFSKINGGTIEKNVIINTNLAIGTSISPTYKLNIDGSLFSSSNIVTNNFVENGSNLIDKYLTISNASNIYLSNIGGIISSNLTINSNLGVGISASSSYSLNVNGKFNATSIYNNGNLINFNTYAIKSDVDTKFLLYPTLIYLDNNYINNSLFNSTISEYTRTGLDTNYLNVNNGGVVNGLTLFPELFSSNIITSNLFSSNLYSSNINSLKLNVGPVSFNPSYTLNVNGSINATSIYNNGDLINFNTYAIKSDVDAKFLLYPTLSYLDNYYITNSIFSSTISQYTRTGLDANYLNVNNGGIVNGLTSFPNLFSTNIVSSNLYSSNLFSSNLFSSNINSLKLNVGPVSFNPSSYTLNVNGSINATSIYNNGDLIDFNIYAIKSDVNSKFLLYPTLIYLDNNYVNNTEFNSRFNLYTPTGADPNYVRLNANNNISGNINFTGSLNSLNISNTSNIITSNLLTSYLSINTNISSVYRLNVNGSIYSSNNIICAGNLNEGGTNLINKYLTISNANLNYFSNVGGVITGSLGIGTSISDVYKLNINGSIYSSNNIVCAGNINEDGKNLIDKYLTISNASQNYLQLTGGTILNNLTINNNVGIGANATAAYKLNVNGTIYCNDNIFENGTSLSNKYLSITNGGSIMGNVGIGTILSQTFKLTVNGSIFSSNDIKCAGNLNEGGVNLIDKYLTIANASQYLITGDFLNNQPNLQKKTGFKFICNKPIVLNGETYYKHDIDINQYVKNKIDTVDMTNYRIFNIKCFSTMGIFTTMTANKPPNILQYDVYMSSYPSINICAIGFPSNYYLNKITAGDICLLKTTNYNYISVVSKTNNNSISCIISDFLF